MGASERINQYLNYLIVNKIRFNLSNNINDIRIQISMMDSNVTLSECIRIINEELGLNLPSVESYNEYVKLYNPYAAIQERLSARYSSDTPPQIQRCVP